MGPQVYQDNQLTPLMTRFFGEAHQDYHQNGPRASQPASEPSQPALEDPQCPVEMNCARPTATGRGACVDQKCVIGTTCIHTVPVANGFLTSSHHENFSQYDTILWGHLVHCLPELEVLALDINCKYSIHAKRDFAACVPPNFVFVNGWLHSKAGHDLTCQLAFSSLFKSGVGRLTGEGIEQLWVRLSFRGVQKAGLHICELSLEACKGVLSLTVEEGTCQFCLPAFRMGLCHLKAARL